MKPLSNTDTLFKIIGILGLLALCAWYTYNYFYGERMQQNNGLGWDGATYAGWAQQGPNAVMNSGQLSKYYAQRLLPSFTVYFFSRLFHYDIQSNEGVIHAFYIYNCILLLLSALILWLIGKHLRWRMPVFFLAFAAIFLNYPILKFFTYNPTLTDYTAFTFGLITFYCYLKDKIIALVLVTLIGAFIFPSLLYAAIPLMMFKVQHKTNTMLSPGKLDLMALITGSLLIVFAAFYLYATGRVLSVNNTPIRDSLVPISLACLFLYLFFSLRYLADFKYLTKNLKTDFHWQRLVLVIALVIAIKIVIFSIADSVPEPLTIKLFLGLTIQSAMVNPGISVVTSIMFYGPVVLLMMFFWKDVTALMREKGLGLVLFAFMYILLAMRSEARQCINAWPVFAILTCEVMNRYTISWKFCSAMMILCLVMSRCWLTINVGPWDDQFLKFPEQMMFMSTGPWTSHMMYDVFLAVCIIAGVAVYALLQPIKAPAQSPPLKKGG